MNIPYVIDLPVTTPEPTSMQVGTLVPKATYAVGERALTEVSAFGARELRCTVVTTTLNAGSAATVRIEGRSSTEDTWETRATVNVSATGRVSQTVTLTEGETDVRAVLVIAGEPVGLHVEFERRLFVPSVTRGATGLVESMSDDAALLPQQVREFGDVERLAASGEATVWGLLGVFDLMPAHAPRIMRTAIARQVAYAHTMERLAASGDLEAIRRAAAADVIAPGVIDLISPLRARPEARRFLGRS